MRVVRLQNISSEYVVVKHQGGLISIVPPEAEISNVTIVNEEELRGKVSIVADLTEVVEDTGMKTKLND